MAIGEQLTNGSLNTLASWTNPYAGNETFEPDNVNTEAKAEHVFGEAAGVRTWKMSQEISIPGGVVTADCSADIYWSVPSWAEGSYASFYVSLMSPGGVTTVIDSHVNEQSATGTDSLSGSAAAAINAGGSGTWTYILTCILYRFTGEEDTVQGNFLEAGFNIDNFTMANTVTGTINVSSSAAQVRACADTVTGTINTSANITQALAFTQTVTGTINVSANLDEASTLKTDYAYYFGTTNGTTHIYSDSYKGDAGVVISCQYVTKDTDFSDQDQESNDRWKTVYAVKLFYEDMSASTDLSVSISTDGGTSWTSQTQTLGTGDETRKDATYWFIVTGQFFRFKVFSGSASTTFKLLGMEVEYQDSGEHWVIA